MPAWTPKFKKDQDYNGKTTLQKWWVMVSELFESLADGLAGWTRNHAEGAVLDHPDQSVTTAKLADGATTEAKLADGSVTAAKLGPMAVKTEKLADYAVNTVKLAAGAVTLEKLAAGAVTAQKLDDGAVTAEKLQSGAVGSEKLADGAVTTAKIAPGAIGATELADGAVAAAKLAAGSVGPKAIQSGAMTTAKIKDGAITRAKLHPAFSSPRADTADRVAGAEAAEGSYYYGTNHEKVIGFFPLPGPEEIYVYDPTTGKDGLLEQVIRNLFNVLKPAPITVRELAGLGLTVQQIKDKYATVREVSLKGKKILGG